VPDAPRPTVAVVAVHGVGRHEPGASARAIANLLLALDADPDHAAYTPFRECPVHIRTRPLDPRAVRPRDLRRRFVPDYRSPLLRQRLEAPKTAKLEHGDVEPDLLFMQGQRSTSRSTSTRTCASTRVTTRRGRAFARAMCRSCDTSARGAIPRRGAATTRSSSSRIARAR
jgi:hypothetical protein